MTKWTLKDGRVLDLVTPCELAALPDGTELLDIFGGHYIKGQDEIDSDTRGGHLAFGLLRRGGALSVTRQSPAHEIPVSAEVLKTTAAQELANPRPFPKFSALPAEVEEAKAWLAIEHDPLSDTERIMRALVRALEARDPGVVAEAEQLLKGIEVFPGVSWPNAFDVEGALIRDVHARQKGETESPWIGGTLAAAKLIAAAPRIIRALLGER